jgi:hypothetical protein
LSVDACLTVPDDAHPSLERRRNRGAAPLVLMGGVVVFGLAYLDLALWALSCDARPSNLTAWGARLEVPWTVALLPTLVRLAAAVPTLGTGRTSTPTRHSGPHPQCRW